MRIAMVAPPWIPVPPPAYGGTEAVLATLAEGLQAAGHDVLLYATGDSSCPVPTAWTYDTARGLANAGSSFELHHVIGAYDTVRDWGADIVHDHTLVGPIYAQRFPDLAVVTTNHGPFDPELVAVYQAVTDDVPLVAISHHQASSAGSVPIAAVIHHGVEVERFPLGAGDGGYALFLGRMHPSKGVDVAVRVARSAGLPLRIAAKMREPAEHDYFNKRVRPLLGGDIEYLGEVSGDAKVALLADAACLLNPIAWPEPFGMVMIEALACGTPVVARPCGAAPEIVDDGVTGYLRGDLDALSRVLVRVGELDRDVCRRSVKERFSATRMVEGHVALYRQVLEQRRSAHRWDSSRQRLRAHRHAVSGDHQPAGDIRRALVCLGRGAETSAGPTVVRGRGTLGIVSGRADRTPPGRSVHAGTSEGGDGPSDDRAHVPASTSLRSEAQHGAASKGGFLP